jgi:hypothetical protein
MGVSREEIKQLKIDGWTFRIKTVKGKRYISRRKGKQEKGLGRYNDGLWKLIENTTIEPSHSEWRREAEKIIEGIIDVIRPIKMSTNCSHIIDGYCHLWRFSEKPGFFNIADDRIGKGYYRQIIEEKDSSFWVFKAEPFYCRKCSAYIAK